MVGAFSFTAYAVAVVSSTAHRAKGNPPARRKAKVNKAGRNANAAAKLVSAVSHTATKLRTSLRAYGAMRLTSPIFVGNSAGVAASFGTGQVRVLFAA